MALSSTWVAVGLGSNLDNRFDYLQRAATALCALPMLSDACFSPIYESAAVDCPDPRPFLNAAARFRCHDQPNTLLAALQQIEHNLARTRAYRNAPRTIDLDLLLFGDRHINTAALQVPHPRFHLRLFVTTPLCDIAGDWRHPHLGATIAELDQQLRDDDNHGETPPVPSAYRWPTTPP